MGTRHDKPRGNKWFILISFVTGLSFGVHFMGLLTIPAIGLIYFFKNYQTVTTKKFHNCQSLGGCDPSIHF